jgi:hypothetical protein
LTAVSNEDEHFSHEGIEPTYRKYLLMTLTLNTTRNAALCTLKVLQRFFSLLPFLPRPLRDKVHCSFL